MRILITLLAALAALSLQTGAQAQTPSDEATINKYAQNTGLIRTDRAARPWFKKPLGVPVPVFKLWPGKEQFFYYEWVLENGDRVTKIETVRLKHVPDHREFADRHPNGPAIQIGAQFVGNLLGNLIK